MTSNMVPGLFSQLMRQRDDAQNEALQVGFWSLGTTSAGVLWKYNMLELSSIDAIGSAGSRQQAVAGSSSTAWQ